MNRVLIFLMVISLFSIANSGDQPVRWFDDELIGSIILLEKLENKKYVPHGTGFLIWNYDESGKPIVVTCSHLLKGKEIYVAVTADSQLIELAKKKNMNLFILEKSKWILDGNKLRHKVILQEGVTFVKHPNELIDVAAFPVWLSAKYGDFNVTKTIKIPTKSRNRYKKDVSLGDEVYFVGFPLDLGKLSILQPLVRSGSIAWLSDKDHIYILDAFSNPGNSGSPIFTKKNLFNPNSFLIGMIVGHLQEPIAVMKSKAGCSKNEVIIAQNIGLAQCVWIDDIMTVVELAKKLNSK